MMKKCKSCNKYFEANLDNFYKSNSNKDGLHSYCKGCTKKRSAKWMEDNEEIYRERMRERKAKEWQNPEVRKRHRLQAKKQRELGYQKKWRQSNPDKIKQYNQYRTMNKTHNISKSEWLACKEYFNNQCAYCGLPIEEHYTTYRGETKLGDFHKEHVNHNGSNDLSNCVPSCKSCNTSKHTFTLEEWYNKDNENYSEERLNKIIKWINEDYKLYIKIN